MIAIKCTLLTLLTFLSFNALAQLQFLNLPNGAKFGAAFPCQTSSATVNSAIGVTNALRCRVEDQSNICDFLIAEQPLDAGSFNKYGFAFIQEVHKQFAKQVDPNYKPIKETIISQGGIGKKLDYELIRHQDGINIDVKGSWFTSDYRMMRISVSCAPSNSSYMKSQRELFLNSIVIVH